MKKFTTLAIFALMATGVINADTYFCSPEGAGDKDGSSWENAKAADIDAIFKSGAAKAGDIFYMLEGKYVGSAVRPVAGITIVGGFPAASTGTDISKYNPWKYKTIFDGEGKDATEALVKISGNSNTENLSTIKGIVITGGNLSQDGNTTFKGAAFNCTHAYVLMEDVVFDNNKSNYGGVVVPASQSNFHAKHCVWINNKNTRKSTTKKYDFHTVLSGRGSNDKKTNVVLEGCVMHNNIIEDEAARAVAQHGGQIGMQDGCANLMVLNCFSDGGNHTISQSGGFLRMGNSNLPNGANASDYCGFLVLAFNSLFNYSSSHSTETKGHIISINKNMPYYLQGNIIVHSKAGASVTPDYNAGTVAVGNNLDIAIFTQGFDNTWGKFVSNIASGGNNTIGGFLVATIQKDQNGESGSLYKTTFLTDHKSDNWSAPAQSDVFEGVTTEKDGRYYILPKEEYMDVNTAEALKNFENLQKSELYQRWFGWADVDASKDLFGNERAATTYRGAYDPNASFVTLPTSVNELQASKLSVKPLGNGVFSIQGAEGNTDVYDITGRHILTINPADETFSIADAPAGVYVIRTSAGAVKVIR